MKNFLLNKFIFTFCLSIVSIIWVNAQSQGDIIITEYMANPNAILDTDGEYFELYNTTSSPINIEGWLIKDDDTDSHTIVGETIIPAYGFLVLGRGDGSYNSRDYLSTMILANSIDEIILLTPEAVEICRVNYTSSLIGKSAELNNISNHTNGVSLESDYVASSTDLPAPFSADKGSPGTAGKTALESTPPTWTGGYPTIANISATNLDLVISIDEAGTAYYVVLNDGDPVPSATQVKAGNNDSDSPVALSGSITIVAGETNYTENIALLTASTAYDIYVVAEDDEGTPNIQASATRVDVSTPGSIILETFDTDLSNWNTYNESGDTKEWTHNTDHAYCSGFDSGELEIDWLISPILNQSFLDNPNLIFDLWWNSGIDDDNNYLNLYYSTDYNGDTANLGAASWNKLTFPTPGNPDTWTTTENIDISSISGDFYLAFEYHYNSGNYRSWGIDNIALYGTDNGSSVILLQSPLAGSIFDTEENVTVDFVTYNQSNLLKLEVWNDSWFTIESDIDPASVTATTQVSSDATEASTYKLRLTDQTIGTLSSNEVPFSINDITGPVFNSFNPADESTDISRNQILTIYFNENIKAGTGNIVIKKYDDDTEFVSYPIDDASIDITGSIVTINHTENWPNISMLYVEIAPGVIVDMQDNTDFSITNKDTWNFKIADEVAPVYIFDPANEETNVALDATIKINFDEAIFNTDASVIDKANVKLLISLKDTDASGTNISYDATIDVDKKIISIIPTANFEYNQTIYISVADVEDAAGNESVLQTATFTTIKNNDATLSDLTIDATKVTGFDPATFIYNVILPYGTTDVPTVAATENNPEASIVVEQATNIEGTLAERTATVTVTAENLSIQDYTIIFSIALNTENDILTFDFKGLYPDVIGIINTDSNTGTLTIPYGTLMTSLVPTITVSADATINPLSGIAQDFSSPVIYTVIAQDGTNKEWEVSVIKTIPTELSIYEIQSNSEGVTDSPYLDKLVKISGVVTGIGNGGFFMQDTAKAWNGIYINTNIAATVGDSITIVGYVDEFQSGTLITKALEYIVLNSGVALPDALVLIIAEAINEKYESVLITINNLECTVDANLLNEYTFRDENENEIIVDDILYNHTFIVGNSYSITGIRQTYYGNKLCPRDAKDVNNAPKIQNIILTPLSPTSKNEVTITATITDENVDATDLIVGLFYGAADGSEDNEVNFTQVTTTDEFKGTIPASSSDLFYKITASDGAGINTVNGSYSISVGINNPDGIISMNIFPNPSNGLFILEMNASKAGTFNVEIINIQGQVLYNKEIKQDGFYKETIDISENAEGIYYIRISDDKDMKVTKLMIQ